MIVIEHKEIYLLQILACIYNACSVVSGAKKWAPWATAQMSQVPRDEHPEHPAVRFRSCRALMAVRGLVCRVANVFST